MGLNSFARGSSSKSVVIRGIFSVFIAMLVFVAAFKSSAQPQNLGLVSPFAFATPLTSVSIVPRVHHGEDHNACRVDVIVAYDITNRLDVGQ